MESKNVLYGLVKQIGRSVGRAEKVVSEGSIWATSLGKHWIKKKSGKEFNTIDIIAKRVNEGELTVLSEAEMKEVFLCHE